MEFRKFAALRVGPRSVCCVAVALALVLAATTAQAAPLSSSPPGFISPVPIEPDPLPTAVQIAQTSLPFTGTGFSGVLVSTVYRRPNQELTFTYQLQNNAASANVLHRVTMSSFAGFTTDASTQAGSPTIIVPTLVDRSTPDVVGFSFLDGFGAGPIRPGQQSSLLVVETNAITHSPGLASIIDGTTAMVGTFAPLPAIPEPATWALGILGTLSLIGLVRRGRR